MHEKKMPKLQAEIEKVVAAPINLMDAYNQNQITMEEITKFIIHLHIFDQLISQQQFAPFLKQINQEYITQIKKDEMMKVFAVCNIIKTSTRMVTKLSSLLKSQRIVLYYINPLVCSYVPFSIEFNNTNRLFVYNKLDVVIVEVYVLQKIEIRHDEINDEKKKEITMLQQLYELQNYVW